MVVGANTSYSDLLLRRFRFVRLSSGVFADSIEITDIFACLFGEFQQLLDDLGMLVGQVGFLGDIGFKVVQLGGLDRDFVEEQRNAIGVVAETIRDLATRGVPVADALDAAEWPYPREELAAAVRRGYEQLPRSQRRLPLV